MIAGIKYRFRATAAMPAESSVVKFDEFRLNPRFQLTSLPLESSLFWHITSCSPLKVYRRFGEGLDSIFRVEELCLVLRAFFLAWLIFLP
jgi:hypothetical protein